MHLAMSQTLLQPHISSSEIDEGYRAPQIKTVDDGPAQLPFSFEDSSTDYLASTFGPKQSLRSTC
jgi:hypothetical protein